MVIELNLEINTVVSTNEPGVAIFTYISRVPVQFLSEIKVANINHNSTAANKYP